MMVIMSDEVPEKTFSVFLEIADSRFYHVFIKKGSDRHILFNKKFLQLSKESTEPFYFPHGAIAGQGKFRTLLTRTLGLKRIKQFIGNGTIL